MKTNNQKKKTINVAGVLSFALIVVLMVSAAGCQNGKHNYLVEAELLNANIWELFASEQQNLLNETYPFNELNKVSYLADQDTINEDKVSYLWPYSGMLSASISLYKATNNAKYKYLIDTCMLRGLNEYLDTSRKPVCYQSYISKVGYSDRFYDDNIWIAIDLCDMYLLTKEPQYLTRSLQLWQFIQSGMDDELGGGIYWCEQKKRSKNVCSNAPAAVLACKLFKATNDSTYFGQAQMLYEWTKKMFQDKNDYLYFDNCTLDGRIDSMKYAYNSGQMVQASALLYKISHRSEYLSDAQKIAVSAINHFTKEFQNGTESMQLINCNNNWFATIMIRGFCELHEIDASKQYLKVFEQSADILIETAKDQDGLFGKDWSGNKQEEHKWLLDQASLVEFLANLSR